MRKILLLPLLCVGVTSLFVSLSNAQQPKVFILSRSNYYGPQLDSAVGAVTKYDTGSALPTNVSAYAAIFVVVRDTLSTKENLDLIQYLKEGGKLYIEPLPRPEGSEVAGTLNYQIGIRSVLSDNQGRQWSGVSGIDTEFTKGFNFLNPIRMDVPTGIHWSGLISPVLIADGTSNLATAWIPNDLTIHAVIHHPAFPEYYSAFVQLVLCDYFHVCSLKVTERAEQSGNLNVSFSNGLLTISYNSPENKAATLKIENDLGEDVMEIPLTAGQHVPTIASTLPSGEYFAVVNLAGKAIVRAFSVIK